MKLNKAYEPLLTDKSRFVVLYGGAGSSKSYSMAQFLLLDIINRDQPVKWLVLRKIGTTIKESVFSLVKDLIYDEDLTNLFTINKTEKSFTYTNGSQIIMMGLDDPEKIKSIHGITKVWMEEATEFSGDDFHQLNLRLRGLGEKRQYFLSFNPIDENHWLKQYFFDNRPDDCSVYHTTYKDNKFLDDEYKKELNNLKDIDNYYYEVYCLGKWGIIGKSRVFTNLVIDEFSLDISDYNNVRYGMDFGFNHASTLMGCGERDNELYIFFEIFVKNHTNIEFIKAINESSFDKSNNIKADSAEPDRIKEFKQHDYKVFPADKGSGSVRRHIDYLKSFKAIHIHRVFCPNAAREFQAFKFRELKDGFMVDDFVEINDDTISGVRYAIEDLAKMRHNKIKPSAISAQAMGF